MYSQAAVGARRCRCTSTPASSTTSRACCSAHYAGWSPKFLKERQRQPDQPFSVRQAACSPDDLDRAEGVRPAQVPHQRSSPRGRPTASRRCATVAAGHRRRLEAITAGQRVQVIRGSGINGTLGSAPPSSPPATGRSPACWVLLRRCLDCSSRDARRAREVLRQEVQESDWAPKARRDDPVVWQVALRTARPVQARCGTGRPRACS